MARLDKMIQEEVDDPYFVRERYHDPSVCTRCKVVFTRGVFAWEDPPPRDAAEMLCPACRRIEEHYTGGQVVLEGEFLKEHKDEILNTIKRAGQTEKARRPLERIMDISAKEGRLEIKTTYEHMARRVGEAVRNAFKGELKLQYLEDEKFVRVHWKRD